MIRLAASFRVLGPAAPRRGNPWSLPEPAPEHETWLVDTAQASVAALWLDGTLWLGGDRIHLVALRRTVDEPTIVAVASAPAEPVLCVHLVGGIDRSRGELVGFALQRIWT